MNISDVIISKLSFSSSSKTASYSSASKLIPGCKVMSRLDCIRELEGSCPFKDIRLNSSGIEMCEVAELAGLLSKSRITNQVANTLELINWGTFEGVSDRLFRQARHHQAIY